MILASVWPEDLKVLSPWIRQNEDQAIWQIVIAPHEVSASMLTLSEEPFSRRPLRLSHCGEKTASGHLLVDTIGDLAYLYRYADLAYVGGGFGKGIHSILEPVAAGLPVVFGPHYHGFQEARSLLQDAAALSITNTAQFEQAVDYFSQVQNKHRATKVIKAYLSQHAGGTTLIMEYLLSHKLLA